LRIDTFHAITPDRDFFQRLTRQNGFDLRTGFGTFQQLVSDGTNRLVTICTPRKCQTRHRDSRAQQAAQ
jgi:hypothetical protein